jgi:phenol 2-monooxygenase
MITYDYVPERGIQRGNPCSNIVVDSRFPYEMTAGIKIIEGTLRDEFEKYGGRVLQPVVPLHLEQITAHGEIGGEGGVSLSVRQMHSLDPQLCASTTIQAKYLIGADGKSCCAVRFWYSTYTGARSWVRKCLGVQMEGEMTGIQLSLLNLVDLLLTLNLRKNTFGVPSMFG